MRHRLPIERNMNSPFDLDCHAEYALWRAAKLANYPVSASELLVDVVDPFALSPSELSALQQRCKRANMAIYRSTLRHEDKNIPRQVAAQLGLHRLDCNWLADEDGISPIAVAGQLGERGVFIPYTNRPIKWHTDGYYQPPERHIQSMVLHCVRPAASGGENALLDQDMIYIAMRDANPDWVRALMAPDAMSIPARQDDDGVARGEQNGPVFAIDAASGELHMRYTARTRSIAWKDDPLTRAALAFLEQLLASDSPAIFRLTLQAGMGLVCNNVLHDRAGFTDDPAAPRLLYRARYLDRITSNLSNKSASSV